jgi:hypothetical protein
MSNQFDEFRAAMREAKTTMWAADSIAEDMADSLRGRLRKVSIYTLKKLKRELSQFNANTGRWKENS